MAKINDFSLLQQRKRVAGKEEGIEENFFKKEKKKEILVSQHPNIMFSRLFCRHKTLIKANKMLFF